VSMMSVAGEAWPSQLDGRTTLPRPRDLAGELCTPRPPRSHAGNTGTCGQRATGPGLGLPPVIEHVGALLKRPSSARTHGTRVRRSRRATSWDRYTLLAPANRRRPCHEGVGGPHPQREHGREAPAGELPLAVGGSARQRILSSFPLNAARRWASSATMFEEDGPARRHDDRRGIDADVHGEDRAPLAVASCAAPRSSATTGRGARSKLHSHSPW